MNDTLSLSPHISRHQTTHVVVVLLDDGLVEADGLLVLVLHEEHVGDVQLPGVVLVTNLHRLAENLLHHLEVLSVPVDLRLSHQHHDVPEVVRQRSRRDGERNKSADVLKAFKKKHEFDPTMDLKTSVVTHLSDDGAQTLWKIPQPGVKILTYVFAPVRLVKIFSEPTA